MAIIGLNARATLAFVTDPAGTAGLVTGDNYPTTRGGLTFGGTGAGPSDDNATFDPRIAGRQALNTWNTKPRLDLKEGNGLYRARCALGDYWGVQPGRLMVWDGQLGDGVNIDADAGNMFDYAAGATVAAGRYTIYGNNLYRTTAGGTTGASSPPIHTNGSVNDNSVSWTFVKTAVLAINVAVPTDVFTDASGAARSAANWAANNAWSANFALTKGFVTLTKHTAGIAIVRHFALDLVSATLADLNIKDRALFDIATIYTNDPEGVTIARFTATSGANVFSLTGNRAAYFEIVQRGAEYEVRTKIGAGRMPSSAAAGGTLGIIQTDASATNGPTRTTWIVGNGGPGTFVGIPARDTETNRHDQLLDSRSWMKIKPVLDAEKAEWPGYANQAITQSYTVTNQTEYMAAWNAIASGRDGASWYRIAISGAGWAAKFDYPAIDMGAGGLLVEPAAGHDPLCEWMSNGNTGTMRFVHIRKLRLVGQLGGGRIFQFPGNAIGGKRGIVKISDCRVGRGHAPGYSLISNATQLPDFLTHDSAEQLILENNVARGVTQYMAFANCFYAVTRNDDATDAVDDAFAPNTVYYNSSSRGIFPDDDCRFLNDGSKNRATPDIGDQFADGEQPHCDYIQFRDFQYRAFWAASKDFATSETPVGTVVLNPNNDNLYTLVTRGVSASSGAGPAGTGNGIVDGGSTWNFFAAYPHRGRKMLIYVRGGANHGGGVARGTTANANLTTRQWVLNSHMAEAGNPLSVVCVNCASFSPSAYGLGLQAGDYGALIQCTFGGPGICPAGSESASAFNQNPGISGTATTEAYVKGSILGPSPNAGNAISITQVGAGTPNMLHGFDQGDNLPVDWRGINANPALEPSALLVGPAGGFANQSGVPIYSPPIDISAMANAGLFWAKMLAMARPLVGSYGVMPAPDRTYSFTLRFTDRVGDHGDVALTITEPSEA